MIAQSLREVTMKKALLPVGIAVLVLFWFAGSALCAPRAVFTSLTHDAGQIPQGKDLSTEFLLKNAGNEPLTFKVRPC